MDQPRRIWRPRCRKYKSPSRQARAFMIGFIHEIFIERAIGLPLVKN